MPYKSKQSETEANKGKPGDAGQEKAGIKNVDVENHEQEEMLSERYTKDDGAPDPDQVYVTNRNRNTNKPDIDKPAYGGS